MSRVVWTILVPFCLVLAVLAVVVMARDNISSLEPKGAAEALRSTVTMEDLSYSPQTLTVSRGTTVAFDNNDVAPHTITADEGSTDSGLIDPGKAFSFVVNEAFTYHCEVHPSMTAEIQLEG